MNYLNLINNSIDYIENNINSNFDLEKLAYRFNISLAHYNRIFKFITGFSLKKYISFTKLTASLEEIKNSNESIINIAMNFGYDYPEVFSRAFKKQFGLSPLEYRKSSKEINTNKPEIINKEIVNINGVLSLKGKYTYIDDINLTGISINTNINTPGFFDKLQEIHNSLEASKCYHVISCLGDGENFNIFYGYQPNTHQDLKEDSKVISPGWYIKFKYNGDMNIIYKHLRSDIESTFKSLKIPLVLSGIGMFLKLDKSMPNIFTVYVPIKREE